MDQQEDISDEDLLQAAEELEDAVSDEDLLQAVEELEDAGQSGGGGGQEGYFNFRRTQFREKTAKSYGIKRTSYHLQVENPRNTFPVGHGNIIRAFEEGLANSIQELIDGLTNHGRIQIYLRSNRLRNSHTSANVSVEQWHDLLGASRQVPQLFGYGAYRFFQEIPNFY